MSRIGYKPIYIPDGVTVSINQRNLTAKGQKGELNLKVLNNIEVEIASNVLKVTRKSDDKPTKAYHGLTRALIFNMITGVSHGFTKKLELRGVGFKASLDNGLLSLNVGFSHPVLIKQPEGIEIKLEKNTIIISGIDKQAVGEMAAKIRQVKKPEPYKGKGIRYEGEIVRKKAGKTSKTAGAS